MIEREKIIDADKANVVLVDRIELIKKTYLLSEDIATDEDFKSMEVRLSKITDFAIGLKADVARMFPLESDSYDAVPAWHALLNSGVKFAIAPEISSEARRFIELEITAFVDTIEPGELSYD